MIFQAPPGSGAGSVLRVHRVVESLGHGRYTTAGDANPTPDAAAVPRENLRSRAVIEVPYVGLPIVWLDNRQYQRVALWLLLSTLLVWVSFRRLPHDPPRDRGRWGRTVRRCGERLGIRRRRHRGTGAAMRAVLAMSSAALVLAIPTAANAAFTDTTRSGSNTWKAAALLRQPYTSAVMADTPYAFYRLDEASGVTAADYAGNSRSGAYTAVSSYRQAGALPRNPGYAVGLSGTGRMVGGGAGILDPQTFSVEMWFRTTTPLGGKLFGFESTRDATSSGFDREAFMRVDGTVVYMGSATSKNLLASSPGLNNGAWHHLVVTSVPSGALEASVMYVDGVPVASGTTLRAGTIYAGWWRVGYGTLPTGKDYPASSSFAGSVDDVATYTTALSATRVTAHYAAR
jgi:hypothetical protein